MPQLRVASGVRACGRCREPAVVCVNEWGTRRFLGLIDTGTVSRRDFRCQACGAGFALLPGAGTRLLVGIALYGSFFLIACLLLVGSLSLAQENLGASGGLLLGALIVGSLSLAGMKHSTASYRHERANPIVPNALIPEMRFREVGVPRKCRCGVPAPLEKTVANTTNGIPTGTDYTHLCVSCGASFEVSSAWGLVFLVIAGSFFAPLTYLFLVYPPGGNEVLDWENLICLSAFCLATLFAAAMAGWGAIKRWVLHPPMLPPSS